MAWTASGMFREFPAAVLQGGTGYTGLDSDTIKAALYDNDITPTKDAANNAFSYNTGQWVTTGNEVADGTNWDAGGEPLTGKTFTTPSSGTFRFDATDTPQGGTSTTLANVFGCLVYNDTVTAGPADPGITFHYFGGGQSVTAGTFTIVWHANGLFQITV